MDKPALKIFSNATQNALRSNPQTAATKPLSLIIADENFSELSLNSAPANSNIHFLTHRYDVFSKLKNAGYSVEFNDLELEDCSQYSEIYFRVSKEKPLSNHVLKSIFLSATLGTRLFLCGLKNEGIKGYYDKCRKQPSLAASIIKEKDVYSVEIIINSKVDETLIASFDSKEYSKLREIEPILLGNKRFSLFSKPGVFSWKSVDQGSQYLSETLYAKLDELSPYFKDKVALDLGCGHGHLSVVAASLEAKYVFCTDNNAAALIACEKTCKANGIEASFKAGDAGSTLTEKVELIVCNPPFHQGFSVSNSLVEKFVASTARLLAQNGRAYFVCNVFVGIEALLQKHKLAFTELSRNQSFKVLELRIP